MSGSSPLIFLTVQGLGYGFLAGVTIGPFLGYIINVVLTRGWRRSLSLITIPPLVDTPIIIVVVFLLGTLPEFILDVMSIVGGTFVLWLGWTTWKDNLRTSAYEGQALGNTTNHDPVGVSLGAIYVRGLLVNALNPAPYLFWSTVSGPLLLQGMREGGAVYGFSFLLAYYGVFLTLILVLMLVVERLGELNERSNRYILPVTIVLMIVLGLGLIGAGVYDLVGLEAS